MDLTSFDLPPPPPPTTVPSFTHHVAPHPPYAEMIYKAIEALKEKDGSSKRAIGKYIEHVYKQVLPPEHSTLLTQHLNHLKSAGLLIMFKKSYKLPSSLPPPPTLNRSDHSEAHLPFTPLTQRGRGRPPKHKPIPIPNAQPVFVSLDPPPPTTAVEPVLSVKRGRGRPPGTFRSKSIKKPKSVSNGLKRRPGRPPKTQSHPTTVIPFAAAAAPAPSVVSDEANVSVRSTRPRGRPKKYSDTVVPGAGATRRGRPKKLAVVGRPKNPSGRPIGRPKGAKGKKFVNEDLRRKLEHFQSKVKESLDILKPLFDHQSPATAVAAIQELEMLATLDLKAPLRDETLQPQQFPEPQPLQQELPSQQLHPQPVPQALPSQQLHPQPVPQAPPSQQLHPQQVSQAQNYEQQYRQMPLQQQVQQLFQPHNLAPS